MPRLIVNADDFGRSPGVSRGIIDAHRLGIVTSTTLMVNLPWSDDAARLARETLGVGLHLTFSYGAPVSPDVRSLLGEDGRFNRHLDVLRHTATLTDIDREARAQLQRFVMLLGRLPTHLDSHQHVHAWPRAVDVIARLVSEHRLPVRAIDPKHRARLHSAGIQTPDDFLNDFYVPGSMTLDGLLAVLSSLPQTGVTELMCHPGHDDDALADSTFRVQREDELRLLCSHEVRLEIERCGIELMHFGAGLG